MKIIRQYSQKNKQKLNKKLQYFNKQTFNK